MLKDILRLMIKGAMRPHHYHYTDTTETVRAKAYTLYQEQMQNKAAIPSSNNLAIGYIAPDYIHFYYNYHSGNKQYLIDAHLGLDTASNRATLSESLPAILRIILVFSLVFIIAIIISLVIGSFLGRINPFYLFLPLLISIFTVSEITAPVRAAHKAADAYIVNQLNLKREIARK